MVIFCFISGRMEHSSDFTVVSVIYLIFILYLCVEFHSVSVVLGGDLCFCLWTLVSSCFTFNGPIGTPGVSVAL